MDGISHLKVLELLIDLVVFSRECSTCIGSPACVRNHVANDMLFPPLSECSSLFRPYSSYVAREINKKKNEERKWLWRKKE